MTVSETGTASRRTLILEGGVYCIAVINGAMVPAHILGSCRTSGQLFLVAVGLFLLSLALTLVGWLRPPRRWKPVLLAFVATCANLLSLH
jgi:hypothetical protein